MPANNLSANTLFHFTGCVENIESILENKFYPRYCMENLDDVMPRGIVKQVAIPMVCFCDIPLSQIKNHMSSYGKYAIGLSKEWAKNVRINPVMYIDGNSYATSLIKQAISRLTDSVRKEESNKDLYMDTVAFSTYLKKYEGNKWNAKNFDGEVVRFYDEREWRYVPSYKDVLKVKNEFFLTQQEFLDERDKHNEYLKNNFQLKFNPHDIKYIIVKDEDDVLRIQDKIRKIFGNSTGYDQVQLLESRIITMKQILEDF